MPIILLFLISFTFAESFEIRNLLERTFTRDNTYCQMGKRRIEIQIRGDSRYTETKDSGYGIHFLFYPVKEGALLPLNGDKLNTYRLFKGSGSLCSKSYGFLLDENTLAVLFLKENRPYKDKLSIQLFNLSNISPGAVVETNFLTDQAESVEDGFIFRTFSERNDMDMGTVTLFGEVFTYQDRDFRYWMKYNLKGFEILPKQSFLKSEWKDFFKDEKDFSTAAGWSKKEKAFKNQTLYVAVNHKLKKRCVLLADKRKKLTGSEEGWRCLMENRPYK